MSSPSKLPFGAIGFGAVALAGVLLLVMGPPRPHAVPAKPPAPIAVSITANGFTLTSAAAALPTDDAALPPGPHREAVEANCTGCHSAAMLTAQPGLTREQWQASVEKMVKVHRAPIPPADRPRIVDDLASLQPAAVTPAR